MPVDLPEFDRPLAAEAPEWAQDDQARAEDKYWADENKIKGQKTNNNLLWLRIYGLVLAAITVVFTFLFLLSLIAWSLHYLLPECWHWLSADQLSKIQSVLFSGGMGAVISAIAQRQLSSS